MKKQVVKGTSAPDKALENEAFAELVRLYYANQAKKHSQFPAKYVPKPDFSDSTSNSLTKCILKFLEFKGHYVTRINSQGQWNGKLQRFTRGTTKKGTADLHSIIGGRHCSIEIKLGRDVLSDDQKKTQVEIEKAGGVYLVVKTFAEFFAWYRKFSNE